MSKNHPDNKEYKILVNNLPDNIPESSTKNVAIESHTCFFQLILGVDIGKGETLEKRTEILYERLIVECSEFGFNIG